MPLRRGRDWADTWAVAGAQGWGVAAPWPGVEAVASSQALAAVDKRPPWVDREGQPHLTPTVRTPFPDDCGAADSTAHAVPKAGPATGHASLASGVSNTQGCIRMADNRRRRGGLA